MSSERCRLNQALSLIIADRELHARWLNTLSYLENCGARKIAACEHPTHVKETMLKHAAEEFRHAHYLKKQISKVKPESIEGYTLPTLLGNSATLHYLNRLDLQAARFLHRQGYSAAQIRDWCYLTVTYAIELRAETIYPIYEHILRKNDSPVRVKSIVLEEEEHLEEMRHSIAKKQPSFDYARKICAFEEALFESWIRAVLTEALDYQ